MPEIIKSLTFKDLPTRPPLAGRPKISDDIQQTAALLVGWDGSTRRLIRVSPSGVLYVAEPIVLPIINKQATADGYTYVGDNLDITEVLVKAKPSNVGRIWANVYTTGAVDTGYPLDCGDWVKFSMRNLNNLHLYFTKDDDWVIIVSSK